MFRMVKPKLSVTYQVTQVYRMVDQVHGGGGVDARNPHEAPPAQVVAGCAEKV